jgi:hypothetical protein
MEASFHLLCSRKDQENINSQGNNSANTSSNTANNNLDNIKRKLINDTCQGVAGDKAKVLNLHSKQPGQDQEKFGLAESLKMYGGVGLSSAIMPKKNAPRQIQTVPEKILDAPDYLDDFCMFSNANFVFTTKPPIHFFSFFNQTKI